MVMTFTGSPTAKKRDHMAQHVRPLLLFTAFSLSAGASVGIDGSMMRPLIVAPLRAVSAIWPRTAIMMASEPASPSDPTRTLLALQSGLSLRERRRIELAVLPNETLPEERLGLSVALAAATTISSATMLAGGLPPQWDVPLFGTVTIAVSMLLQVVLSPTCLDGQGSFGRLLRSIGWRSHGLARGLAARVTALLSRPSAFRARAALMTQLANAAAMARRVGALVTSAWRRIVAWAEQVGLAAALGRLHARWQQTPMAAELSRMKAHLEWNWNRFLKEVKSQQTQESIPVAVTRAFERRKRGVGESR